MARPLAPLEVWFLAHRSPRVGHNVTAPLNENAKGKAARLLRKHPTLREIWEEEIDASGLKRFDRNVPRRRVFSAAANREHVGGGR